MKIWSYSTPLWLRDHYLDLDRLGFNFLVHTNIVRQETPEQVKIRLIKAQGEQRRGWLPEAALIGRVLEKAWKKHALKRMTQVVGAFTRVDNQWRVDEAKARKVISSLEGVGEAIWEDVEKQIGVLVGLTAANSERYWKGKLGLLKKADMTTDWSEWLAGGIKKQYEAFVKAHPERVVGPEIERLIQIASDNELSRKVRLTDFTERLERVAQQPSYWARLSDVEQSFQWNAEGIIVGWQNGVTHYGLMNPMDDKTCPVCEILHGTEYTIEQGWKYVIERAKETDPERIRENFPFPRFKNVDNIPLDELQAKGFCCPPFHGNCRDEVVYLRGEVKREGRRIAPPTIKVPAKITPVQATARKKIPKKSLEKRLAELVNKRGNKWTEIAKVMNEEGYVNTVGNRLTPSSVRYAYLVKYKVAPPPKIPKLKPKAKPKAKTKPKKKLPGQNWSDIKKGQEIVPGAVRKGERIEFKYYDGARFKTKEEAVAWVKKHLAYNMVVDEDVSLDYLNYTLQHIRWMKERGLLVKGMVPGRLTITKIAGANGRYTAPSTKRLVGRIEVESTNPTPKQGTSKVSIFDGLPPKIDEKHVNSIKLGISQLDDRILILSTRKRVLTANEKKILKQARRDRRILEKALKKAKAIDKKAIIAHVARGPSDIKDAKTLADSWSGGTMVHEYGHFWHDEMSNVVLRRFGITYDSPLARESSPTIKEFLKQFSVSRYSETNFVECIAENYTVYMHGEVRRMHPEMVRFFDEQFPQLAFGRKIDYNRVYVDYVPMSFKKISPDTYHSVRRDIVNEHRKVKNIKKPYGEPL